MLRISSGGMFNIEHLYAALYGKADTGRVIEDLHPFKALFAQLPLKK